MAVEAKRGCGYRKVGGLYLVGPAMGEPCHRLPWPLGVCPCCGAGIKPTRGFQWIGMRIFEPECTRPMVHWHHCERCPVCTPSLVPEGRAGMIWIGEQYYKTADEFMLEARMLGISRRISRMPRGFKPGEHYVLLAHRKAIVTKEARECPNATDPCSTCTAETCTCECHTPRNVYKPGVVAVFKPTRVELILRESEATRERREREAERGITVVSVPDGDPDHDPGNVQDRQRYLI